MSGRTRNVAQETSERAAELDNKVKWLDLLKADAIERTRAVTAQYTQAFKALNNEIFAMQRVNPQTGAVQIPYDTPEEYTSFANVLIEAESLLLDLQEYQTEALIEQEFFEEADAFLEAEKEKARKELAEASASANAHVEKGVLHFAKSCFQ